MQQSPPHLPGRGWFALPLFVRIAIGLAVGLVVGASLHGLWHGPVDSPRWLRGTAYALDQTAGMVLRLLNAVAFPLILLAVVRGIMTTEVKGAGRLTWLLVSNMTVAILIGLAVANVVRPGRNAPPPTADTAPESIRKHADPLGELLGELPNSLVKPLVENNAVGVVVIALAFGVAGRRLSPAHRATATAGVSALFEWVIIVLHWILELVPLAVAARVAFELTTKGFAPFASLGLFVVSVIAALLLQACFYLLRVWVRSWVTPRHLLAGTKDALVMAFSTGSSTATMPLAYECMTARVGVRPESASMGVMVGGGFNHDGTALYEAMSALFVAQALQMHLSLGQQLLTIVTSMVAAVGAAGIPEAGLVTMTMVFNAVGLPVAAVGLLLPVDWFLDRCRTAINVMGDTSVACLLDGKTRPAEPTGPAAV